VERAASRGLLAWLALTSVPTPAWSVTGIAVLQQLTDGEDGITSLGSPDGLAISSPDGAFVYVGSSDSVTVFARDPLSGTLAIASVFTDPLLIKGAVFIALSPDGANAYTRGAPSIVTFARNGITGALTQVDVDPIDGRPSDAIVAPDGAQVYVADDSKDRLYVYSRASLDGMLTLVQTIENEVGGVMGLNSVHRLVISADGAHLYAASPGDDTIAAFSRNLLTGELTFLQAYTDPINDTLRQASDLALSPDGDHLYVAAGTAGLTVYARDAGTGLLTFVESTGTNDPHEFTKALRAVAVSDDGTHVAAGSITTVVLFDRDATTGMLTFVGGEAGRCERIDFSPDGANLYVVDSDVNVLVYRFFDTACSPAPLPGCKTTLLPAESKVQLKYGSTPSADKFDWKWKGEATTVAEFGDPVGGTDDVIVCLYDQSGLPQPVFHSIAPAGGVCADRPCWSIRGVSRPKLKYRDRGRRPDGFYGLDVTEGADHDAKVKAKGKDRFLLMPALPLTAPVTVQLQSAAGTCWTATFSTPNENDAVQFKAKSD
jgi:6-phosphogluconolactonase (cycloisomerase 2 family)